MELLLMVVTVVSLALAIGMSAVGWALLRESRQRSAARVEALQTLSQQPETWDVEREPWGVASAPPAKIPAKIRVSTPAPAIAAVSDSMFGATVEHRVPARRWLTLAAVTVLTVAASGVIYMLYRPTLLRAAGAGRQAAGSAAVNSRPLELLSLTHATEQDGTFTITGLVENPAEGTPARGLLVVVYLFDASGNYFASGRAALDVAALQPGDESPFVVRVPNANHVGRYRVGFRLPDGGVAAHIDRRGQPLEGTTEVAEPTRASGPSRPKGTPGA